VVVRRIERARRAGVETAGSAMVKGAGAGDEVMPLR
jgi:hypothetical protein